MNLGRLLLGFIIIIICDVISSLICGALGISGILSICISNLILSFVFAYIYFPIKENMLKNPYFYRNWSGTFIILFLIDLVFSIRII